MQRKCAHVPALALALCFGRSLAAAQDASPSTASSPGHTTLAVAPTPGIAVSRSPFTQGRIGLSLWAGTTFTGHNNYLKLGASVGVYLIDGLRLGFGGQLWLFDDPFVATLTPELTYTFHFVEVVKPYVGTFYSHYFVSDDVEDFDSLGARAGIYVVPHATYMYFGGGIVYERLLDCDTDVVQCDDVYPEVLFAFVF